MEKLSYKKKNFYQKKLCITIPQMSQNLFFYLNVGQVKFPPQPRAAITLEVTDSIESATV